MHILSPFGAAALIFALAACQPSPAPNNRTAPSAGDIAEGARPVPNDEAITAASRKLFRGLTPLQVRDSPIPGLKEVIIAGGMTAEGPVPGGVFYASADGQYFMQGDMIEVATLRSKTEESRAIPRQAALRQVDIKDAITFPAKGAARHEVYVFTDTDCGYCQQLHKHIADYNARGITVRYFPWPRSGTQGPTFDTMVSVWCAKDQRQALTTAKAGKPVPSARCNSPVGKYVEIGHQLLISGTPAIFSPSGRQLGGYVTPADLEKALNAPEPGAPSPAS